MFPFLGGFGDDDWSEDTSDAVVKQRELEGLSSRTKGLTMNDELELSQQDRLQIFYNFLEVWILSGPLSDCKLMKLAIQKCIYIVFRQIFTSKLASFSLKQLLSSAHKAYTWEIFGPLWLTNGLSAITNYSQMYFRIMW